MTSKLPVLLAAIAILAVGGYWWSQRDSATTEPLTFYGNVDVRQVSLAFEGSGRLVALLAEEGDVVKAGQVVATLDTRTLAIQAKQAAAQAEVQRQTLLRLQSGARPEELAQVRAQLASAEAGARLADEALSRALRLQDSGRGAISQQSVDEARATDEAALAKVAELRAALALTEAGARKEEIAGAEAQLQAAEASLALLRHQIDQGQLRAPSDAVVRSRLREPGDMITAALPVFALALTRPKWVRIYVSEPDLGRIRPGMAARVLSDSAPDAPVEGRVGYISAVAEFTPKPVQTEELRTSLVYEVRVVIEDAADRLRLGQPVTVQLVSGSGT